MLFVVPPNIMTKKIVLKVYIVRGKKLFNQQMYFVCFSLVLVKGCSVYLSTIELSATVFTTALSLKYRRSSSGKIVNRSLFIPGLKLYCLFFCYFHLFFCWKHVPTLTTTKSFLKCFLSCQCPLDYNLTKVLI